MDELFLWPPSWSLLLLLPALFVGFTVHELGHAIVAFALGDATQLEQKRLSFNPLRHVSWVGLIVFLLFGFGWAKPVRVDASRFRVKNRALGMFAVSVAGASANLITALVALVGMLVTVSIVWTATGASLVDVMQFLTVQQPGLDAHGVVVALSQHMVRVNLVLAFFNLLPLPPLDGFHAAVSLVATIRTALGRRTAPRKGPGRVDAGAVLGASSTRREVLGKVQGEESADSSPAQIHFGIGLEYHRSGQLDEAIARYRQATDHDERFGLAYYNLGLAYWDKGRIALAMSAFRAARACPDLVIQVEASRRLRELTVIEQNPDVESGAVPPPLAPAAVQEAELTALPAPNPEVMRRAWLSLAAGGAGAVLLAAVAWMYVTAVTLGEFGGSGLF